MSEHAYKHFFIQELLATQSYHEARRKTAHMRNCCLPMMEKEMREEILSNMEEKYARQILGSDWYTPPDGA